MSHGRCCPQVAKCEFICAIAMCNFLCAGSSFRALCARRFVQVLVVELSVLHSCSAQVVLRNSARRSLRVFCACASCHAQILCARYCTISNLPSLLCSAQAPCASCSAQALRARLPLRTSAKKICAKMFCASCSAQVAAAQCKLLSTDNSTHIALRNLRKSAGHSPRVCKTYVITAPPSPPPPPTQNAASHPERSQLL